MIIMEVLTLNTRLGELIRQTREEKNITSSELAKIAGVSQGTISNIENGKFGRRKSTISTLKTIIKGLDIKIEDEEINSFLNSEKSALEEFTLNTSLDLLNNKPEVFVDEDSQISVDELKDIKNDIDASLEVLLHTKSIHAKKALLQIQSILNKTKEEVANELSKLVLNDVDTLKSILYLIEDKKKGE